jgi:hypothetical protein
MDIDVIFKSSEYSPLGKSYPDVDSEEESSYISEDKED